MINIVANSDQVAHTVICYTRIIYKNSAKKEVRVFHVINGDRRETSTVIIIVIGAVKLSGLNSGINRKRPTPERRGGTKPEVTVSFSRNNEFEFFWHRSTQSSRCQLNGNSATSVDAMDYGIFRFVDSHLFISVGIRRYVYITDYWWL